MPKSWGTRYTYGTTWGSTVPSDYSGSGSAIFVGNFFTVDTPGHVVGMRYFRNLADGWETHGFITQESDNRFLAVVKFPQVEADGEGDHVWQHAYFQKQLELTPFVRYNMMLWKPRSHYYYQENAIGSGIVSGHISVPEDESSHWNGQYAFRPDSGADYFHAPDTRFGVDILFLAGVDR